ncbi:GGDEF domain-containing protein [Variovorax sp. PAMC26660]|uniref:sensor domain-containing diguanylate cyclase n=1 Tax=Variovorax sp. PAMC26660 TaxID=2762322 RepID=UPI0021C28DE8|nr:GGDEF domain-containing protein [Variovorax sp. PAMC26660]
MIDGASYGLLAGLMVCGLVLLLVFGSVIHGYYALACACALVAFAGLNGLAPRGPSAHWPAAALVLWTVCRLQFGRHLLRLKDFAPRLDRVAQATLVLFAIAVLYAALETQLVWTLRTVQALAVASTVILAVGAVMVLRRLPWPAALFLAGAALLIGGISATPMSIWLDPAWAPRRMNFAQAAVIAELMVFVIAIGVRLRADRALEARTQQKVEDLGTDALTGATSRAGFESRGRDWLREGRPFSLMLADLNGFSRVNERHGRAGGDAVLAAMARRLRQQVRADDMVARLGGDEFAILLVGTPARHKLAEMAIRMLTAGARPVEHDGRLLAGGELNFGIASHPVDGDTLESIVQAADRALRHCEQQRMGPAYAFAGELHE